MPDDQKSSRNTTKKPVIPKYKGRRSAEPASDDISANTLISILNSLDGIKYDIRKGNESLGKTMYWMTRKLTKLGTTILENCCKTVPVGPKTPSIRSSKKSSSTSSESSCSDLDRPRPRKPSSSDQEITGKMIPFKIISSDSSSSSEPSKRSRGKGIDKGTGKGKAKHGPYNKYSGEPDMLKVTGFKCQSVYYTYRTPDQILKRIKDETERTPTPKRFYMPYRFWYEQDRDYDVLRIQPLVIPPPQDMRTRFIIDDGESYNRLEPFISPDEKLHGVDCFGQKKAIKQTIEMFKEDILDILEECLAQVLNKFP